MADFLTFTMNELLNRIGRLEAQVSICIQNQEALFLQASNCQLAQECLKLAEDFGDEQFSKGNDQVGTTNGKKWPNPCPIQGSSTRNAQGNCNSSQPIRPVDVTPPSPMLAQIPNTQTQGMKPPDEVRAPNKVSDFLRGSEIMRPEPIRSASGADDPALSTTDDEWRRQRQRHQRKQVHHGCQKCGLAFSTAGYLLRHVRKVHSVRALESTCANRFQCEFCGASYGKRNSLRAHQNRAHGHFSKGVGLMDMGMARDGSSGGSATLAAGDQTFVCQICGKSYRNQGVLDYHIYMHTRERGSELNAPRGEGESSDLDPNVDVLANLSLVWGSEEVTRTTRTADSIGENQN